MRLHLLVPTLLLLTTSLACNGEDLSVDPSPGDPAGSSDEALAQAASEPLTAAVGLDLVLLHACAQPGCAFAARHVARTTWRCADGVARPSCPVSAARWPGEVPTSLVALAQSARGSERVAVRARWRPDGELQVDEVLAREGSDPLAARLLWARAASAGAPPAAMDVTPTAGGWGWRERWLDVSSVPGDDAWRNRVQVAARSPEGLLALGRRQGHDRERHLVVDDAFVPRSLAPTLCAEPLRQAIAAASEGLLWPSESDRPIDPLLLAPLPSAPTGSAPASGVGLDELRAWLSLPASAAVENRAMQPFAWLGHEDGSQSDDERAGAARFRALRALLESQLEGVETLATGAVEVRVLVVGRSRCGELAGVQTVSIET